MPQTFYVASDEEILSVVSRLRSSALLENVFVVPKRALILQSIVNLRMLSREAEKLGKSVVIVTQDEQGRALAEKLGLPTRVYSDDMKAREEGGDPRIEQGEGMRIQSPAPYDLGSDEFFSGNGKPPEIQPSVPEQVKRKPSAGEEMHVRIRDNSPTRLTSLHSSPNRTTSPVLENSGVSPDNQGQMFERSIGPKGIPQPVSVVGATREIISRPAYEQTRDTSAQRPTAPIARDDRVQQFFGKKPEEQAVSSYPKLTKSVEIPPVGRKGKAWFSFFAVLSVLSLVGVGLFLFVPKAEILVTPQSRSENINILFKGDISGTAGNENIAIRLIEKEEETVVTVDASGTSSGGTGKAKGWVVLSNAYGKDPQSLVATTRIESADGKIFRLTKGVTIPGATMINGTETAGAIEAEVVADQTGEGYDLPAGTIFTIPGFKGGPKYGKFGAESKDAFSGGGGGAVASSAATITVGDIEKGKNDSRERFRALFEAMVGKELGPGEKFLSDSEDISMDGMPSHPDAGIAGQSFEYRAKWKGRVYVFSETDVKERVNALLLGKIGQDTVPPTPEDITVAYDEAASDFDAGILSFNTAVSTRLLSRIDTEKIRDDLLGKGSGDIKAMLDRYPEIQKIEINLKPDFFAFSVPKDKNRVMIVLKKE
jgi:hypothetical protein